MKDCPFGAKNVRVTGHNITENVPIVVDFLSIFNSDISCADSVGALVTIDGHRQSSVWVLIFVDALSVYAFVVVSPKGLEVISDKVSLRASSDYKRIL